MGRIWRLVRDSVDRRLHPLRRRAAQDIIHRCRRIGLARVSIVCLGNICRSPYAARMLSTRFPSSGVSPVVAQGGFIGPDRGCTEIAIAAAARRGVDLRDHRSRLITAEDLRQASIVIVMEPRQVRLVRREAGGSVPHTIMLGDLDPLIPETRAIRDPFGRSDAFYDVTYARIERCVVEFARLAQDG